MSDDARGGDDTLIGVEMLGIRTINDLYGDAYAMSDNAQGGNDTLTGGDLDAINFLVGDAYAMSGSARGGDDTLTGQKCAKQNVWRRLHHVRQRPRW